MRAWLSRQGVTCEERDFFKNRFSEGELRNLLGGRSPSEMFSWRSPSFARLGLDPQTIDDERLIAMMLDEPRLIRRPLVLVGGELIDGRDREALTDALSGLPTQD